VPIRRRPPRPPACPLLLTFVVLVVLAAIGVGCAGAAPEEAGDDPPETAADRAPSDTLLTGTTAAPVAAEPPAAPWTLEPYGGLGAWVDVFDFAPAYQADGSEPALSADDVDEMARR